jgi:3-isopropylmalate/(R)-2-methylmalate dehydratase small subunit
MDSFTVHEGLCAALSLDDVDTDQIIPKQFLKRTERDGYGDSCFFDWRYDPEGKPRPEFELNHPAYRGASVLVTGRNFGCGSSREHAAWALTGYGFRAVLAASFADIFNTNALANGLLPVPLAEATIEALLTRTRRHDGYRLTIDLGRQEVRDRDGVVAGFDIEPFWRECLLSGRDPIAMALSQDELIRAFELERSQLLPVTSGLHRL